MQLISCVTEQSSNLDSTFHTLFTNFCVNTIEFVPFLQIHWLVYSREVVYSQHSLLIMRFPSNA
jgi:hypothetical protein